MKINPNSEPIQEGQSTPISENNDPSYQPVSLKAAYSYLIGYFVMLLIFIGIFRFIPQLGFYLSLFGVSGPLTGIFIYHVPDELAAQVVLAGRIIALLIITRCVIPWCFKTTKQTRRLLITGIIIWFSSGIYLSITLILPNILG